MKEVWKNKAINFCLKRCAEALLVGCVALDAPHGSVRSTTKYKFLLFCLVVNKPCNYNEFEQSVVCFFRCPPGAPMRARRVAAPTR